MKQKATKELAEVLAPCGQHSVPPNKALQTDKGKLSRLLRSQEPRQLAFAAELGR